MTTDTNTSKVRRTVLKVGATASLTGLASGGVWAAGSDKPEKEQVKIGFIPLTDCASVVMASVLGLTRNTASKSCCPRSRPGPACATSWSTASSTRRTCCMAWSTACRWASAAPGRTWPS